MKNVIELKIDPDFQSQIPPLTEEEFKLLRENILKDGEVYEPIVVWDQTIVDGHNRWKIILENWDLLKDHYSIKKIEFPDKWAAFEWMYRKQLGRRNLTEPQWTYMIGKLYQSSKYSVGGQSGNENAKKRSGQNVHFVSNSKRDGETAEAIGAEYGITGRSVRRAEKFSRGVDALKEVSADAAEKVLKGDSSVSKAKISTVPKMDCEGIIELANSIISGQPIPNNPEKQEHKPRGWTKADREERTKLETIATDMYDRSTVPEYTVENLVDDIQLCAEGFVQQIKNTLKDRSTVLTNENKTIVADAIDLYIIKEIEKVRNLLK